MKTHPFENLPKRKSTTKDTEYTKRFEAWLDKARKDSLLYVNIYYGDKSKMTYESFCEEFMRMKDAPTILDKELF